MAKIRLFHTDHPEFIAVQQRVIAFLLAGSMLGALCAKLHFASSSEIRLEAHILRNIPASLLHAALFPTLLAAALILRRKALFYLLFFCSGAVVCDVLCSLFHAGLGMHSILLLRIFLDIAFSLPVRLFTATVWLCEIDEPAPSFWLYVPTLAFSCFGVFLQTLLL